MNKQTLPSPKSQRYDTSPLVSSSYAPYGQIGIFILYVLAAMWFAYAHFGSSHEYPPASIYRLADFTAERPYQYRALIPALLHLLFRFVRPLSEDIAVTIDVVSLLVTFVALTATLQKLKVPRPGASVLPLLILWSLWYNNCFFIPTSLFYYPYDLPSIAFFAVGIYLLLTQNYRYFYPVYLLACANRETALFLTVAYICLEYGHTRFLRLFKHTALQLVIWAVIFLASHLIFRHNPGVLNEEHVALNLEKIYRGTLIPLFGWTWIPVLMSLPWLPAVVRRMLLVIPPFFAVMFYFGRLEEARIYNELNVILAIALGVGLCQIVARLTHERNRFLPHA